MLACYEGILEEEKRSLSLRASVLDFVKSHSRIRVLQFALFDIGTNDPCALQEDVFLPKYIFCSHRLHFDVAFMGKSQSTKQSGFGITYDATSGDDSTSSGNINSCRNQANGSIVAGNSCKVNVQGCPTGHELFLQCA